MFKNKFKDFKILREHGIIIDNQLGYSEEYDSVFEKFIKLSGQIGQFENALKSYKNSPHIRYWIIKKKQYETSFIKEYKKTFFYSKSKKVIVLPKKWISDIYFSLLEKKDLK